MEKLPAEIIEELKDEFKKYDADGDGLITKDEYKAYHVNSPFLPEFEKYCKVKGKDIDDILSDKFASYDLWGDGYYHKITL